MSMLDTVLAELRHNPRTKHLPEDQLLDLAQDIHKKLIAEWIVVARHEKTVVIH